MSSIPLVSVFIPSYNHAQYLSFCVESVLAQTYSNVEIIIVDDGSSDNSLNIARNYRDKNPDLIRVYTHPNGKNCGISKTVNLAISLSKGKYWSGLPSDDVLYKNKIEKQVAYLENYPELGFVYSYGDYIDKQGHNLPGRFGEDIAKDDDPLNSLLIKNVIPGMTVLASRKAAEEVGLHDENLIYSDWDFWLRFVAQYKFGFIPESLVEYRVHDYNTSLGIPDSSQCENNRQVYLKLLNDEDVLRSKIGEKKYQNFIRECLASTTELQARLLVDEYFAALTERNFAEAKNAIKKAFRLSPRVVLHPKKLATVLKHGILSFSPTVNAKKRVVEKISDKNKK